MRSRVPEKLPTIIQGISGPILLQEVIFNEHNHYTNPDKKALKVINENQAKQHGFSFYQESDKLKIEFWMGFSFKKNAGTLNPNNWCQIKANRRYPLEHTWAYHKIVCNVFYGEESKLNSVMNTKEMAYQKDFQSLLK